MKFKEKYSISPEFEDLFGFDSQEEELEHDAKMIMFRFFSELEKVNNDKEIKNKDLAEIFGSSQSYVTQLMRGDKLINLLKLAKLQNAFDVTFEIRAKSNLESYEEEINHFYKPEKRTKVNNEVDGLWVFHSFKSVYDKKQNVEPTPTKPTRLQVA